MAQASRGDGHHCGVASLSTPLLALAFVAASGATWAAGILLSQTTDELDRRLGLGDAIGGVVLLGIGGSLPELAITVSAAASGNLDIAAGNLIGGIATATMVLVVCDLFAPRPLTYLVGSLVPVLEGLLVIEIVAVVMMGALLPSSITVGGRVSPVSIAIVVAWLAGVLVLNRARSHPRWRVQVEGGRPGRPHHRVRHPKKAAAQLRRSTARVALVFTVAAAVTLVAGVVLEVTGNEIADRAGINGVVFGATVLSFATALPEVSSGIEAVRLGDHQLAMGDVFGGNAFQLCLFLLADVIAGKPALPLAGRVNSWLAALAIVLTMIYVAGVIVRPSRPNRVGPDSALALGVYALGIVGLFAVTR